MNRQSRRTEAKRKQAIARELVRMEKPEQYGQGFHDGGVAMSKAAEAAFATAMYDAGFQQSTIIRVLRKAEDKLSFFAGEDELIQEAYDKLGIIFDESAVFSNEKFSAKE